MPALDFHALNMRFLPIVFHLQRYVGRTKNEKTQFQVIIKTHTEFPQCGCKNIIKSLLLFHKISVRMSLSGMFGINSGKYIHNSGNYYYSPTHNSVTLIACSSSSQSFLMALKPLSEVLIFEVFLKSSYFQICQLYFSKYSLLYILILSSLP